MNLEQLRARMAELLNSVKALSDGAAALGRDMTDDEIAQAEGMQADFDRTQRQVLMLERQEAQAAAASASNGRRTDPPAPNGTAINDGVTAAAQPPARTAPSRQRGDDGLQNTRLDAADRQRWGWTDIGTFALAVKAATRSSTPDPRLVNAPTTYGQEAVGADGGFAVPPEFREAIMQKVQGENSLLAMADNTTTGGSGMTVPQDNTTPWQTTGGIQAYWDGEAELIGQSKPALGTVTNKLNKLTALVPVTDENLEDAASLASWINRKAPEKMDYKIQAALIDGTGVGMPLGILNGGSTVTVSKESSQAAATLLAANVLKMYARMYAPWRFGSVWFVNQDLEPALMQMTINVKNVAGTENVGGSAVYIPPGGLSASPYGMLLGRPVMPIQACKTLGTKGDIIFASMKQYWAVTKSAGVRSDSSIHLFFDYGLTAFRFTFRLGGQPWHSSPVTPANGSNTLGAFVALETRG